MDRQEVFIKKNEDHISDVRDLLNVARDELFKRCLHHDESKTFPPERDIFIEYEPKLKDTTYGSEEYKQHLSEMQVALAHHYKENRHHPEHFPDGIKGMNLIDLIEMTCDWIAASRRHSDGDVYKSAELNQERFGYSDELKQIIINTIDFLEGEEK